MAKKLRTANKRRARANAAAIARPVVVIHPRPPGPVVTLEDVGYRYPNGTAALDGVSLTVEPGEFVCVIGASGAGKTTLLKVMYGALAASRGRVIVDGESLVGASPSKLAGVRRRFGFVFQDYSLLPRLTALENVRYPLQAANLRLPFQEATGRALEALEAVGLLPLARSFPGELSGGEQQRLSIARALAAQPLMLLADEPTGNLDERNGRRVIALLEEVAAKGTAVLVASHDPLVRQLDYRRLTIAAGLLVEDAPLREQAWRGA